MAKPPPTGPGPAAGTSFLDLIHSHDAGDRSFAYALDALFICIAPSVAGEWWAGARRSTRGLIWC